MTAISDYGAVSCGALGIATAEVYGAVGAGNAVLRGRGFSVTEDSVGLRRVLYETPFPGPPIVLVNAMVIGVRAATAHLASRVSICHFKGVPPRYTCTWLAENVHQCGLCTGRQYQCAL